MAKMDDALSLAQSICWDEGYGYQHGGHAASHAGGVDCGGLVFHCLNAAGYSVSDTSPGVSNMPSILTNLGFVGTQYSGNLDDLQHGDIITMVHWEGSQVTDGHTCFIARDVQGYVHGTWGYVTCDGVVDNCSLVKVEASGQRGHSAAGDHDNGYGCYNEVWVHTFNNLYDTSTYDPSDVYVWRDPNYTPGNIDLISGVAAGILEIIFGFFFNVRRRHNRK